MSGRVTERLARFVSDTTHRDLPDEALHEARRALLDSVGCAVGGLQLPPGQIALKYMMALQGGPEAPVLGTHVWMPVPHASFVNSVLANALDYDDTLQGHLGATIIPPGLCVATAEGISGRELLRAIVLAYDVSGRIGQAVRPSPALENKARGLGTFQIFGAATVTGALKGLDAHQMSQALGVAGTCAPIPSVFKEGITLEERPVGWLKNNFGWVSMGGVMSVNLVLMGLYMNPTILDGDRGFWRMVSDRCDFAVLTEGLGTDYLILKNTFKPYPCCRLHHSTLDAAAELRDQHGLRGEEIESVVIKAMSRLRDHMEPEPKDIMDAQFSLSFVVACVLTGNLSSLGLLNPSWLKDSRIIQMAKRVRLEEYSQADTASTERFPRLISRVTVATKDGRLLETEVLFPLGDAKRPLSDEDLHRKFRLLTEPRLGSKGAEAWADGLWNIAQADSVASLVKRLEDSVPRTTLW